MPAAALSDVARERLAARARRTARIRRGVGAATLATFALAWGVIAHDGSMGATTTTTASATPVTGQGTTTSSSSSSSSDNSAPATTAQS